MTINRTDHFDHAGETPPNNIFGNDEFEQLANRFKLLGEPARLRILTILCDGERNVQELCEQTGLLQANVSKHLQLLKATGIVTCRREGIFRYYCLIDTALMLVCCSVREELAQHRCHEFRRDY
ncbi:MAG: winged helix-turn-helix transcriptional regulator [Leptolyngbya sp. UWPOB_LEPTO1]|uniref:ArsR/SmtB family transcription factor n=1 Tax=Leptolyngbya sp. UWPOB_LEPTO1 TaxID=2815653 RepID=UPI001AC7D619|nr:metalloregulator ArsR/SmtB family transcription factor [Leptolyngbya sp. UWPOB_LEPTO1]MBN8563620.1 winged helix-turn-helix transcriptional regulator [Leptolyngbya sp. UWPOB_LEPTO1]